MNDVNVILRFSDEAVGLTGWGWVVVWMFVFAIYFTRGDK